MKSIFFFLFLVCGILAQAQSPFIESISVDQGLSQGFVPSICQDEDGFLWFATQNGLNRYDGYHFKVFRNDPFDTLSLNSNEIRHIQVVGDFLFVITTSEKPMLFHRKTHNFYSLDNMFPGYRGMLGGLVTLSDTSLCAWYLDVDFSRFYLLSWSTGLDNILATQQNIKDVNQFLHVDTFDAPEETYAYNLSTDKKHLWLLTKSKVMVKELASGSTTDIPFVPETKVPATENIYFAYIVPENAGIVRAFLNNMLCSYDGKTWITSELPIRPMAVISLDTKKNTLWMCTRDQVFGFDLSQSLSDFKPVYQLDIAHNVKSGFVDNSGILWIGTDAHGIRKYNPRSGVFKNFLRGYSVYCQPVFNGKRHVLLSDLRKTNWFSKILDINTGESENLTDLGLPKPYDNHLCATQNGAFWWLAIDGIKQEYKLVMYDPEKKAGKSFDFNYSDLQVFPELIFQSPGMIWIVTATGLIRFNTVDQTFKYIKKTGDPLSRIIALEFSRDGVLWIGTVNGLIKAKPEADGTCSFKKFETLKGNRNSLPTNSIKSLLADPADPDILWIGTNGKGLCRFDTGKNQFSIYSVANGVLPDDVVYGILADDEKPRNLWISTNRGITRFSPGTGFSQHFSRNDGLQDNEFNTYASFKAPDGRLFFGGVNGLTVFNPKDLTVNASPSKFSITNLTINDQKISPKDSTHQFRLDISFLTGLELYHYQNNLSIDFAVLDFTLPDRNQYMFYLEGAEETWVHRGFDHSAQYLNLSPGTYTFHVKGANSNGVWNNTPISLKIVINPPWYLSWPAYLVYAVLFVFAGFLFNQYQLRQRLRSAEAKRLKNLDEFKSRFFTNITHEFRTPLTVILGMTDNLMKESKTGTQPLTLIKRNGENLLRLINQILDLAKLESHDLKLNYAQGDVLSYIRYISESLHSMANAQNVMLRVESNHSKIIMDFDPERILQIIHNLLSNAIKFTPSGGKVIIGVSQVGKELTFSVTDSGIGIPPEALPYVFDRFYQANNQDDNQERARISAAGGTGIGLSLTRELVQAMGGTIAVESPLPGNTPGTVFTVKLPVTNNAPMKESAEFDEPAISRTSVSQNRKGKPAFENTVLLIEDNPDVSEYLALCLGNKYNLEFAFNGRAGIEKALETIPDLIVSDVMMPEKDGFEVCDFLKNDERTSHIPIVLLTAKATVEARIAGLRCGADAYLAKPFHEEELLVWVEQLIARQRLLQARYKNLQVKAQETAPSIPAETLVLEDAFVIKFKKVLEENYADPEMSVEILSAKMGMSRAQLYRKLQSLTGRSVNEHLNSIRLEKARYLLKTSSMNISEVAYDVGFNDPKYFGRVFSEAFGQSPGEFAGRR